MASSDQNGVVVCFRGDTHQDPEVSVVPHLYTVPGGDTLRLILGLTTVGPGTSQAQYPTNPDLAILWKTPAPPDYKVSRDSDTQITIQSSNMSPTPLGQQFLFRVGVDLKGGLYYSPDPVIFNQGQGGGMPDDVPRSPGGGGPAVRHDKR